MNKKIVLEENIPEGSHSSHSHLNDDIAYQYEPEHEHTHVLEDGTVVTHVHGAHAHLHEEGQHDHEHGHGHHHHHENTKAVINRMNRAIGHMESIKTMVESGRDCSEVLIQIAAVRSAINNIGKVILEEHINSCVVDAIETGDQQVLDDLNDAIKKFIK